MHLLHLKGRRGEEDIQTQSPVGPIEGTGQSITSAFAWRAGPICPREPHPSDPLNAHLALLQIQPSSHAAALPSISRVSPLNTAPTYVRM